MMLPDRVMHYTILALEGAPEVYGRLLLDLTDAEADARPDPARFTLREAIAHVADWEGVFLQRMTDTRDRADTVLQGYDEGQWALDHDYAHTDVGRQLARFREGRAKCVAFVRDLSPEQMARTGRHTEVGPISLQNQILLMAAHDGYHFRQCAEFRR